MNCHTREGSFRPREGRVRCHHRRIRPRRPAQGSGPRWGPIGASGRWYAVCHALQRAFWAPSCVAGRKSPSPPARPHRPSTLGDRADQKWTSLCLCSSALALSLWLTSGARTRCSPGWVSAVDSAGLDGRGRRCRCCRRRWRAVEASGCIGPGGPAPWTQRSLLPGGLVWLRRFTRCWRRAATVEHRGSGFVPWKRP